jgi:hypothetical protein
VIGRKALVVIVTVLTVAACTTFCRRREQIPEITEDNSHRISKGMKVTDVESVLGRPPGDYEVIDCFIGCIRFRREVVNEDPIVVEWNTDSGSIQVLLDNTGCVVEKDYSCIGLRPIGFFKFIRSCIKLRIH